MLRMINNVSGLTAVIETMEPVELVDVDGFGFATKLYGAR